MMKTMVLVCLAGILLVCMSGCQCGCLENQKPHGTEDLQVAYQDQMHPSYPVVSMQTEICAEFGKSF